MSVLIEAISVVVRRDAIESKFLGGWEAFMGWVANRTLCADADLARVGFMAPADVKHFVDELQAHGLSYIAEGRSIDIVVVDQQRGLAAPCDWIEVARVESGSLRGLVMACRRVGSSDPTLMTPDGWVFEGSLSQQFTFIQQGRIPEYLDFVHSEGAVQVYRDIRTGKLVYTGRTS
jgi:hypothetical protein